MRNQTTLSLERKIVLEELGQYAAVHPAIIEIRESLSQSTDLNLSEEEEFLLVKALISSLEARAVNATFLKLNFLSGDQNRQRAITNVFIIFNTFDLFNQGNYRFIVGHANPFALSSTLDQLKQTRVVVSERMEEQRGKGIVRYTTTNKAVSLFTHENIQVVLEYPNLQNIVEILSGITIGKFDNYREALLKQQDGVRALSALQIAVEISKNFSFVDPKAVLAHSNPHGVATALLELSRARLLTEDNYKAVLSHLKPSDVVLALGALGTFKSFSDEQRNAVLMHRDPKSVASALKALNKVNLLTDQSLQDVLAHKKLEDVANALERCCRQVTVVEDVDQANCSTILRHAEPEVLGKALQVLYESRVSTKEDCMIVLSHKKPLSAAYAMGTFEIVFNDMREYASILSTEDRKAVLEHEDPSAAAEGLEMLNDVDVAERWKIKNRLIADEENRLAVFRHSNPRMAASALVILKQGKLLTPENREAVLANEDPRAAARILLQPKREGSNSNVSGASFFAERSGNSDGDDVGDQYSLLSQ